MIVNWKENRIKVIPVKGQTIVLTPGINEVPDDLWLKARKLVSKDARIKEIGAKKKTTKGKGPGGKPTEKKEVVGGKAMADMQAEMAEKLIKQTYNVATLDTWLDSESRESVRIALYKQKGRIEKYGEEKARKKNESEN